MTELNIIKFEGKAYVIGWEAAAQITYPLTKDHHLRSSCERDRIIKFDIKEKNDCKTL